MGFYFILHNTAWRGMISYNSSVVEYWLEREITQHVTNLHFTALFINETCEQLSVGFCFLNYLMINSTHTFSSAMCLLMGIDLRSNAHQTGA